MIIPANGGSTTKNDSAFFGIPLQVRDNYKMPLEDFDHSPVDHLQHPIWTKFRIYDVGGQMFGMLLQKTRTLTKNCNVHIIYLAEYGYSHQSQKFEIVFHRNDWNNGWTHLEFFKLGNKTFLLRYREKGTLGNHNIHVHRVSDNGNYETTPVFSDHWSENWTKLKFFTVNNKTWLLRLKTMGVGSNNNNVNIHQVQNDGSILSPATHSYNWTHGWTTVRFYYIGGITYLFLLKEKGFGQDGNNVHIHLVNNDGSIGAKVYGYKWSENWDYAQFFYTQDILYLMLYRKDSGDVHVHHIKDDGGLGSRVVTCRDPYQPAERDGNSNGNGSMWHLDGPRSWDKDWEFLEFFTTGEKNAFLYKMKKSGHNEIVAIHPMTDAGPMVTYADTTQALIWVGLVGPKPKDRVTKYILNYKKITVPPSSIAFAPFELRFEKDQEYYSSCIFKLKVEAESKYEYSLLYDNYSVASGHFTTPPIKDLEVKFKAVFASCMDLSYGRIQSAWDHTLALEPDLLILGGDNVYVNSTDRSMQWAEHIQQRSVKSFARVISEMPVLAVYDDHDFGPDNACGGDRDINHRLESKNTFIELFPNPRYTTGNENGINFYYYWGNVRFIFLDERFFRKEDGTQLLGEAQWLWLENIFANQKAKINVIISSTTISKGESWKSDYASDWTRLQKLLLSHLNTIIVSGDVHFCDILDQSISDSHDPPSITEVISSGIAQYSRFNPAGPAGFASIEFDTTTNPSSVFITLFYKDGSIRDSRSLTF